MIREYPLGGATADPAPQAQHPSEVVVLLPRTALRESPHNPRRHFDPATLDELADSISSSGMLQPIVVRPIGGLDLGDPVSHEIVFGHRRFRAAGMAGQAEVPCIVREMSDRDARIAQHAENLHRQDVHYLEEGDSLADLIASGVSADRIAADLGKSRSYVYGRAKLAALGEPARAAAMQGSLPAELALMIARIPAPLQPQALDKLREGADIWCSTRDAKGRLASLITPLDRAPWPLSDRTLLDHTGQPEPACNACPRNSLNDRSLTDISDPSCLDRSCWLRKAQAQAAREIARATDAGVEVVHLQPGEAVEWVNTAQEADEIASLPAELRPRPRLVVPNATPGTQPYMAVPWSELKAAIKQTEGKPAAKPGPPSTAARAPAGGAAARAVQAPAPDDDPPLTPDELALTDADAWRDARRAIFGQLLVRPVTVADLRWVLLDAALVAGGFCDAGHWLGLDGDLGSDDLPEYIAGLDDDQVQVLIVMLALEGLAGVHALPVQSMSMSWSGAKDAAIHRARIARAYGVLPATHTEQPAQDLLGDPVAAEESQPDKPAAPAATPSKPRPKVRYRCPMTGATWSGRGLKPKWLRAALEQGRTLAELEITE